MDEAAIDKAGFDPIKPDVAAIAELDDTADIVAWLGDAFAKGEGQGFRFGSGSDFQDASRQIAFAGQGGPGRPPPDRSAEHPSEHQSLMRTPYPDSCWTKTNSP